MRLIEVAPGIDIERDILPFMDFKPLIGAVETMPLSAFA
jgi:acyl CoA:acetate/3-ketoacid CoA transferase